MERGLRPWALHLETVLTKPAFGKSNASGRLPHAASVARRPECPPNYQIRGPDGRDPSFGIPEAGWTIRHRAGPERAAAADRARDSITLALLSGGCPSAPSSFP